MTFFELCTAIAFVLFADARCDVAVIEVGLGGRLDATNVVAPLVTAITNIALDHTAHLGTSLEAIAREKAGIIKAGIPVVLGAMPQAAHETIVAVADELASPVVDAAAHVQVTADRLDADGRTVAHVVSRSTDYGALTLGLRGRHQQSNAAVAVALLEVAQAGASPMANEAVRDALTQTRWPGRLEVYAFPSGARALLDAAHNADGARALAAYLESMEWHDATCVLGVMRDKDAREMIRALAPRVGAFVATQASTPRARVAAELGDTIAHLTGTAPMVAPTAAAALDAALARSRRVVVCGSIFLLGDIVPALRDRGAAVV